MGLFEDLYFVLRRRKLDSRTAKIGSSCPLEYRPLSHLEYRDPGLSSTEMDN